MKPQQVRFCSSQDVYKRQVLVTSGGRVLGVTAVADSLFDAVAAAYGAADQIGFEGLHRRSDIGQKALAAL